MTNFTTYSLRLLCCRVAMHAALFDKEMKYLHDNDVRVITRSDLGYDENKNYLYIKS
jgi:hypothetical protein